MEQNYVVLFSILQFHDSWHLLQFAWVPHYVEKNYLLSKKWSSYPIDKMLLINIRRICFILKILFFLLLHNSGNQLMFFSILLHAENITIWIKVNVSFLFFATWWSDQCYFLKWSMHRTISFSVLRNSSPYRIKLYLLQLTRCYFSKLSPPQVWGDSKVHKLEWSG